MCVIIWVVVAEWQAEEVGGERWGQWVFKKSKLAVNNRYNFGTFQICSSGNKQIKRRQHPHHPSTLSNSGPHY